LNRGRRHLCPAGRPSRWALAHILVFNEPRWCSASDFALKLLVIIDAMIRKLIYSFSRTCCRCNKINAVIMAALRSRCGHYIFALWSLLLSSFFHRLISAVADWMSTILAHMVWPQCELECILKCTSRGSLKIHDSKNRQKSSSGHHRTILSGCIFAIKACIDNRKKFLINNTSSTCPGNMANFGQLTVEIGSGV